MIKELIDLFSVFFVLYGAYQLFATWHTNYHIALMIGGGFIGLGITIQWLKRLYWEIQQ